MREILGERMPDTYLVTVEAKDGSFVQEPESWDTKDEALERCELLVQLHSPRGRTVKLYECCLIQSFGG
jgi:hypothetical protein